MKNKFKSAPKEELVKEFLETHPNMTEEQLIQQETDIMTGESEKLKLPRNWLSNLRKAINPENYQKQSLVNKLKRQDKKRKHNLICHI